MRRKKAKKILKHVRGTYNTIAEEFSQTRKGVADLEFLLPYLKGTVKIVDLGCGNGRLAGLIDLKGLHCRYLGIDSSPKLLEIARSKHPNHLFIEGDQLSIPLDDNATDIVINIRAFHHIPSKQLRLQALEEMRRVTKKNGTIIISVWNLWQKKYWKQIAAGIARSIFTFGAYAWNDTFIPWNRAEKRYYHAFTKRELRHIVKKSGVQFVDFFKLGRDYIIIGRT